MSKMDEMERLTAELEGQFNPDAASTMRQQLAASAEKPEVERGMAGDYEQDESDWYYRAMAEGEVKAEPKDEPKEEPKEEEVWDRGEPTDKATSDSYMKRYSHLWQGAKPDELAMRLQTQNECLGHHPWTKGTAGSSGKRSGLPAHEVEALRTEQGLSAACNMPWKERGPLAHQEPTWRGQQLRSGKEPKPRNAIRPNAVQSNLVTPGAWPRGPDPRPGARGPGPGARGPGPRGRGPGPGAQARGPRGYSRGFSG